MNSIGEIINEHLIEMSITYAKEYKRDARNFLNTYKKFNSIRMAASSIVSAYKERGIFKECKESGKDFMDYSLKHFTDYSEAKVFAEFLLIIYSIINEKEERLS